MQWIQDADEKHKHTVFPFVIIQLKQHKGNQTNEGLNRNYMYLIMQEHCMPIGQVTF